LSRAVGLEQALSSRYDGLICKCIDTPRQIEDCLIGHEFNDAAVSFKPVLMLVTLGSPWQEKFLYRIQAQFPTLRLSAAVGGALDLLTGAQKRSPSWLRSVGLEWVWRLIRQPSRWRRIYDAVVRFPLAFVNWRYIQPLRYRTNVACLLYREREGKREILLVERAEAHGHWQIPQGGTDGEDISESGRRELREELNTDAFKERAVFSDLYRYEFGQGPNERRSSKHGGYRGQSQSLYIAQFTGKDADISLNYWDHRNWRWVGRNEAMDAVHECRREAMKIYLEKFDNLKF
jgi:8-oxo-dGTP pyrophosphatase MutT (NUDIX family)